MALGVAVMIVSLCVVRGFQDEIKRKITGFSADIEVLDQRSLASPETYPIDATPALLTSLRRDVPGIVSVYPVAHKMGILKTDDAYQTFVLKGVAEDYDLRFLRAHILSGHIPTFSRAKQTNKMLISSEQAARLQLSVGDRVYAYFIGDDIKVRRLSVAGIYRTNLGMFDNHFALTDMATVRALNSWGPTGVSSLEIRLCPDAKANEQRSDQVYRTLGRRLNGRLDSHGGQYSVLSAQENPRTSSMYEWLRLLDFNVVVILVLMFVVAAFTSVSALLILIMERTRTIGTLKALGAANSTLRHTFLVFALMFVTRGVGIGALLGLGLAWLQDSYGFIKLDPATYYVSAAPVSFPWLPIALVVTGTALLSVAVLLLPTFIISRIQPATAVRYE